MRPEDIRRMYRGEEPATEEEHRQTRAQARTDPEEARRFLQVLYAMSTEDASFAMRLIEGRAAADDAFALDCAKLITDLMDAMRPTPRGKPRPTRSA